jgi:UDP-hydrolysing UDP-N-acetyl-D-glucosamine 2-epimerase
MNKRKICVVVTARPSYSRVRNVLTEIKNHKNLELQLVVSASALLSKYGNAISFIEKDGFEIADTVHSIVDGENLISAAKTTGLSIISLSSVFNRIQPDIVLTIADRYETIATAIAASYMNIPLAHLQGGEVTGNIDEKVRHSITKLSDYHLTCSEESKSRVIKLGENVKYVFNTGCPSIDIAKEVLTNSKIDFNLEEKYPGVGKKIDFNKKYIVVLQHPVTTEVNDSFNQMLITLEALLNIDIQTILLWPNIDAGSNGTSKAIRTFREKNTNNKIYFSTGIEPLDFLKIIFNSSCLVGNSSAGIRESAFLGLPVVNVGSRQKNRERGENVIDVDHDSTEIENAIRKSINLKKYKNDFRFGDGNSGIKIAKILSEVDLIFHKTITY